LLIIGSSQISELFNVGRNARKLLVILLVTLYITVNDITFICFGDLKNHFIILTTFKKHSGAWLHASILGVYLIS
jgi:hypothetical protein